MLAKHGIDLAGTSYDDAVRALNDNTAALFTEMSKLRHELAVAKAPYVAEFVREALEASDKVVVFFYHRDVGEIISATLEAALTGKNVQPLDFGKTSRQPKRAAEMAMSVSMRSRGRTTTLHDNDRAVGRVCGMSKVETRQSRTNIYRMLVNARRRAKERGLPFSITMVDIKIPTHCPALGIPLSFSNQRFNPNNPSLDRITPKLGYVPGNVQVISWRANVIKHDATPDELMRIALFVQNKGTTSS